jgi:hypothetical protein
MSTPCITSFGMTRSIHGLPGSVTLIEDEPALSSRTFRLLHERHDWERRVRALFTKHDMGLLLLQEPLGCLCRRGKFDRLVWTIV